MSRIEYVVVVLVLVLGIAAGTPAVAAVTKTPLDVYIVACVENPGLQWTSGKDGKILHVRGQINHEWLYDTVDFQPAGEVFTIANYDLNSVTGSGGINGIVSFFLSEFSSTDPFIGRVGGRFKSFQIILRLVAKGTGELEGVRRRARIVSVPLPDELLPMLPCPPEEIGGVFLGTGTVDDSR